MNDQGNEKKGEIWNMEWPSLYKSGWWPVADFCEYINEHLGICWQAQWILASDEGPFTLELVICDHLMMESFHVHFPF